MDSDSRQVGNAGDQEWFLRSTFRESEELDPFNMARHAIQQSLAPAEKILRNEVGKATAEVNRLLKDEAMHAPGKNR